MGGLPTWAGLENMLQPAAMERGMVHGWTCNLCQYFGARLESLRLMDIKELKTHAKNYHHFPEEGMDQYSKCRKYKQGQKSNCLLTYYQCALQPSIFGESVQTMIVMLR